VEVAAASSEAVWFGCGKAKENAEARKARRKQQEGWVALASVLTQRMDNVYTLSMDVLYRYEGLEFVWDVHKAAANIEKHGIRFEQACEVFLDP